jgi:arginyl-tRNA synthetase
MAAAIAPRIFKQGMLIQYLREEYPNISSDDDSSSPNITDLTLFYKNAKNRFDEDSTFKKQSQLNVVALQSGDVKCMKMWKLLCDISRKEFQKVYDRLSVSIDEYGESFYNSRIPKVIEEFTEKGLVKVEEGGAKCVFMEEGVVNNNNVPLMLQKSDGGFGYDSTDMAALKYRIQELGATRIIVITDFTQADHFKMCFKAAEMIGWISASSDDAKKVRLDHIGFGTVQGEDGKRFKTRSGDTVRLVDLLDEAVTRMESQLRERISSGSANIAEEELHKTACILGYGAVKYFDLRRNPTSNYIFSYDRMLDTKVILRVLCYCARVCT